VSPETEDRSKVFPPIGLWERLQFSDHPIRKCVENIQKTFVLYPQLDEEAGLGLPGNLCLAGSRPECTGPGFEIACSLSEFHKEEGIQVVVDGDPQAGSNILGVETTYRGGVDFP
jgi:hypothetical protein